jgi:hypothetical protein
MASKSERERIAIELRKWMRSQNRYKTVAELQAPTGIPYSSLKDYFRGKAAPHGDRLQRLAAITGIPSLLALSPKGSIAAGVASQSSTRESADRVLMAIHQLVQELDFFKRGTATDRAVLRHVVPARDVGYATTLLKAMYDEDQFQSWLYFAEYSPKGG